MGDLFQNLLKLIFKEPNLKNILSAKLDGTSFAAFENAANSFFNRGQRFIEEEFSKYLQMYHKVRNISLKYVLKKLYNVYSKMKPVLSRPSTDQTYLASVEILTKL